MPQSRLPQNYCSGFLVNGGGGSRFAGVGALSNIGISGSQHAIWRPKVPIDRSCQPWLHPLPSCVSKLGNPSPVIPWLAPPPSTLILPEVHAKSQELGFEGRSLATTLATRQKVLGHFQNGQASNMKSSKVLFAMAQPASPLGYVLPPGHAALGCRSPLHVGFHGGLVASRPRQRKRKGLAFPCEFQVRRGC